MSGRADGKKLTARRQAFVDEYLVDLNATQAALRAGYTKKNAGGVACLLLRVPEVAEAVEQGRKRLAARAGRKAMDVLADLQKITELAIEQGDLKAALKSLELEGKHLGMFVDRVEHSCGLNLIAAIKEGNRRVHDYGKES